MSVNEFERIVGDYERQLYSFARRLMSNREDAEEVVQDAFVRAYRALSAMSPSRRREIRLKSWLYRITLNVARNELRKKRPLFVSLDAADNPDRLLPPDPQEATPEVMFDRRANVELVENALLCVPAHLRAAARLKFIEGHTHPEIAELFRQPVGTVKSHVHRAALIMRRILASDVSAA